MKQVLVLYASTHGHTEKIASRIGQALEQAGAPAEVRRIDPTIDVKPFDYAAVVAGGSIHAGHHQRELVDWARRHATRLGKTASFAGALQYLEYDFFTRLLIKMMMRRDGQPTDSSQDYDYTDWDAVERFGRQVAELLPAAAAAS